MKIAFFTLGCKVNQYETQTLEQLFFSLTEQEPVATTVGEGD